MEVLSSSAVVASVARSQAPSLLNNIFGGNSYIDAFIANLPHKHYRARYSVAKEAAFKALYESLNKRNGVVEFRENECYTLFFGVSHTAGHTLPDRLPAYRINRVIAYLMKEGERLYLEVDLPSVDSLTGVAEVDKYIAITFADKFTPMARRKRTGNPVVDELVGVEPNPGPQQGSEGTKTGALTKLRRRIDTELEYLDQVRNYLSTNWKTIINKLPHTVVHKLAGMDTITKTHPPTPMPPPVNTTAAGNRPRSGNPVVDGLVGVEPNPGPGGKSKTVKKQGKQKTKASKGKKKVRRMRSVAMPISTGTVAQTTTGIRHAGVRRLFGSEAHVFVGRCPVQALFTNVNSVPVFTSNSVDSNYMFLNPRICAQNGNYDTPLKQCPLSTLACAFRKFCFLKARLHYVPTVASTTETYGTIVAFDPSVITSTSLASNFMAYANVEASAYGPVWKQYTLDATKWIDKSRWYYAETPASIASSIETMSSVQGTFMLAPIPFVNINGDPVPYANPGLFFLDFEIAFSELGPTEMRTSPALSKNEVKDDEGMVHVQQNDLTKSIHIPKSALASLLGK